MNIKTILRPLYVPIMNVWHNCFRAPKRYRNLFREIKKSRSVIILEVGTWSGDRAKEMIAAAQKASPDQVVTYYGFDLFEDLTDELFLYELSKRPPKKDDVEKELQKTGANIELIKGNTLETLPEFANRGIKADFVFIDGGHHVETINSDWTNVEKLMHQNTIVIFDDYWRNNDKESAKPVVDEIDIEQYDVEILPEIDSFNNENFGRLEISFAKVTKK